MTHLTIFALTAAIAWSQPVERVFHFTQLETPAQFNETATVMRSVTEVRHLTVDTPGRNITVHGEPQQAALADWLFSKLDRAAAIEATPPIDYPVKPGSDDVVRIFYFKTSEPSAMVNELATVIRSVLEIRRAFVSHAAGAFVIRGSLQEIDAAKWMMEALERRRPILDAETYRMKDAAGEGTVRLFAVAEAGTAQELNEIAAALRKATSIRRVYTYAPLRVIAVRGTEAQIEHAAGLAKRP